MVFDRRKLGFDTLVFAHVKLTGRDPAVLAMRDPVDRQRAGATNPLPAIVVEMDRFAAVHHDPLVDDVEHLEKGRFLGDVLGVVGFI